MGAGRPDGGPAFITYIKTQLAPTLQNGDVVVMDNLPAHKVAAASAAIKERGAWLVYWGKPSTGRFSFPANSCHPIRRT